MSDEKPRRTLADRLRSFDPPRHGGEVPPALSYVRCSCRWVYSVARSDDVSASVRCWHCGTPGSAMQHAEAHQVPYGAAISPIAVIGPKK